MPPPWGCSHPSFSQPLCQEESGFFPPLSFCLPLEENSIVLFLVVTTWLLATTSFCCRRCRRARGDGWEWPRDARDAAGTSSSSIQALPVATPWWLDQLLGQLLAGMNRCHLHPTGARRGAEGPGVLPVWRRHLTTCPPSQLGAPRGIFGSLGPSCQGHGQQLACAGLALLTMQSDTLGVCLSLEKCPSVLELWRRWTQGCFHECSGFMDIFMDNVAVGWGLLWGCASTHGEGARDSWKRGISSLP